MHMTMMKIIGMEKYESIESLYIYDDAVVKQAKKISSDSSNLLFSEYKLVPSCTNVI